MTVQETILTILVFREPFTMKEIEFLTYTIRDHKRSTVGNEPESSVLPKQEHKRSTRKYNQRPQTEHQRDQRFCQDTSPE